MIIKGFKFGALLQLSIGPVCLFIFQSASQGGFYPAEAGVMGVALVDGLYILAAVLGIAPVIERKTIKKALKFFGAAVLLVFGSNTVLAVFGFDFMPAFSTRNAILSNNVFLRAVILTASNPLTIIFWAGVFSARIAEEGMKRRDIYFFGLGALLSTIFFLTIAALAGSITKNFLSPHVVQILNLAVGVVLLYFSIKLFLKKT